MSKNVMIDGVEYAPMKPAGNRAVVVVDRGWIFAGDVTRANGRIRLARAVHVMRWESVGFAGLVDDPKKAKGVLKSVADVDIPENAEIFCVPVADGWGL
jgi:cytochrome oxidase assembly protein ShyY1